MSETDVSAILQNQGELRATIVEGFKRIDDKFESVSEKFEAQKEFSNRHGVWIREHEEKIDALQAFQNEQKGQMLVLKGLLTFLGLAFTGWIAFFKK